MPSFLLLKIKRWRLRFFYPIVVAVLCATTAGCATARYAYEPSKTERYAVINPSNPSDALLLLGKRVQFCRSHSFVWDGRAQYVCWPLTGPAQLRLPRGPQKLSLASVDSHGKVTSKYELRYDFEPGHVYEVFYSESGDQMEWQLLLVDEEHYSRMHTNAPESLRSKPTPLGEAMW